MIDDEAFIRAIVAAPADEAPRLVYADWLDERRDPRGSFLRAESRWYATRTDEDEESVRTLSRSLADGIWIARVTRPPLGVCCDRLRFTGERPRVGLSHLLALEERRGISLPDQYKAFLLNYNGGYPDLAPGVGPPSSPCFTMDRFYSVGVDPGDFLNANLEDQIDRHLSHWSGELDRADLDCPREWIEWMLDYVPIGYNPDLIYELVIGINGSARRLVTYIDSSVAPYPPPDFDQPAPFPFSQYQDSVGRVWLSVCLDRLYPARHD